MAADPADSALDTIATHLATLTGIAAARRGWPEHPNDLDLSAGPICTVSFIDDERQLIAPWPVEEGVTTTWKVAEYEVRAQLDLWAAYRAQRDAAAAAVEAGLHNRIPFQHGLRLTQADYFDRPLTVSSSTGRDLDDGAGVTQGEWRRRWVLTIVTDLVVQAATPQQLESILRTTSAGTTESDITVTP